MLNRLKIGTKIGTSFALGLTIFGAIAAASYWGIDRLIDTSQWEAHTYQVLARLKDLNLQLKGAESGQRSYIITGDEAYLEPYDAALEVIDQQIDELHKLTADNSTQQQKIGTLESLIDQRIDRLAEVLTIRRQQGFEAARQAVLTNQGRQLNDRIAQVLNEIEATERQLLQQRSQKAQDSVRYIRHTLILGIPLYSILLGLIGFTLARNISDPLRRISEVADRLGAGDLSVDLPPSSRRDEIGSLTTAFNQMVHNLRETTRKSEEQTWLKSNLAEFGSLLQGRRNLEAVARLIMSELAPLVGAQQGVFYGMDKEADPPILKMLGSYAYQERKHLSNQFRLGEGLVGQCALEKQRILLTDVPADYIRIHSGLGEAPPLNIIVLPVLFEMEVTAVIELAAFQRFSDIHLAFLEQVTEGIGMVLNTIAADALTAQLLKQSQDMAEELQQRQNALEESNRLLGEQADELRASETLLLQQQQELQQTNEELQQLNEELEEKAELLAVQKREVERKNQEIERARQAIVEKAEQLALSSKYKSEFLANMSHELRTPLNSLLILARLLTDNPEGNLSDKQVEYSRTILSAGTDLLELINDILDLAKIESGMMSVSIEQLSPIELQAHLERTFRQVAQDRGLDFQIFLDNNLPPTIATDSKRLQQILKNLLANAFKFTEHGSVTLRISATTHALFSSLIDDQVSPAIAFAVTDTGIGISPEKQKVIFEAFQQADGTTSRKYGGTGLGLSISRELAHLLGGAIDLVSQPGQGSTFTLYLPMQIGDRESGVEDRGSGSADQEPRGFSVGMLREQVSSADGRALENGNRESGNGFQSILTPQPATSSPHPLPALPDDRHTLQPSDRVLLIIEDDVHFARILMEMARQQGFKVLISLHGGAGLMLAQEYQPVAIMLDIRLPDMDGWTVLDRLKHNGNTRHIPVHILSVDDRQQRGLQLGAIAYLQKPVSPEALSQALADIKGFVERRVRHLLIIEDDPVQANSIIELIGNNDVHSMAVGTGTAALEALQSEQIDCIVLDLGLPDMSGFDLIEQIRENENLSRIPIIVYTGKELTRQEETQLKRLAETIIVKDVRSPERLLDETALFLHRIQANLPQPKRQILEQLQQTDPVLAGQKVLIVDDDVRNIFALTSLLERYEMQVIYAENGKDGIEMLQKHPDVDVVLMDVMMPELDGYETTRVIRQQQQFRNLPIIALTAKAMQGDREKCLEAGASDYITKPVDTEQLLSLLRVWLYDREKS